MNVPDQVPKSTEDTTERARRQRVLKEIQESMVAASLRVQDYMKNHSEADALRKMHFADTDVQYDDGKSVRMRYFSLWDSMGMRLLVTGRLAEAVGPPSYEEIQEHGADKSRIVTMREMESDHKHYNLARLGNLALQLDKLARPPEK